jgi:hypothetical protein
MEDNFKCYTLRKTKNPGYYNKTLGLKLYIEKDGVNICLNEDEIKEIVSACGGSFK